MFELCRLTLVMRLVAALLIVTLMSACSGSGEEARTSDSQASRSTEPSPAEGTDEVAVTNEDGWTPGRLDDLVGLDLSVASRMVLMAEYAPRPVVHPARPPEGDVVVGNSEIVYLIVDVLGTVRGAEFNDRVSVSQLPWYERDEFEFLVGEPVESAVDWAERRGLLAETYRTDDGLDANVDYSRLRIEIDNDGSVLSLQNS